MTHMPESSGAWAPVGCWVDSLHISAASGTCYMPHPRAHDHVAPHNTAHLLLLLLLLAWHALQRVSWYAGSKHLAVLRADFEAHQFSISHTPYKASVAADETAEELELEE